MKQTLDAIYEDGVFKPTKHLEIPNGQQVRLEVETLSDASVDDVLLLAAQVYEGLTDQDVNEIEQVALQRSDFFGEHQT
jgi:predicted DNA-binding antitoxin AbrB/MazE fold protein